MKYLKRIFEDTNTDISNQIEDLLQVMIDKWSMRCGEDNQITRTVNTLVWYIVDYEDMEEIFDIDIEYNEDNPQIEAITKDFDLLKFRLERLGFTILFYDCNLDAQLDYNDLSFSLMRITVDKDN